MAHANAHTTAHGRLLIVERHQAGWAHAHIAAAMGISRKCVRTWIDRFSREGIQGLTDRSSRPHQSHTRTPQDVEIRIANCGTKSVWDPTHSVPDAVYRPGPSHGCWRVEDYPD